MAVKKRLAEEKRRERAKARQEAKDAELFGRAPGRTISPTPSDDYDSTTGSPERASLSVNWTDLNDVSKPAEFRDVSHETSKGVRPNPAANGESVAGSITGDDAAKTPDTAKKSKKTKKSSAESSPATPSSTSKSESKPKSEKSPGKDKKMKATGSPEGE
jgi:hypothetical protein